MVKFREINALIALLIFWYADAKIENESRQNVILHETIRTLLGFKEIPYRVSNSMPHPSHPGEDAPKYMMDLYEKFKSGPISKGKLSGNTVRSIHAETVLISLVH
ncbi:hypothetical protein CHS0354_015963 [Potamilus streckersoni]|uniref:Uncharacterized protein n=1 Tax=Potamilus streckersoni TaxID=2493646 RepID=A0AAE0VVY7_9BIVA|nr:hypothetical protein CHS0354_015963 [Potamilus streckersoni]